MRESRVGNDPEFFVKVAKALQIFICYAVRQIELFTDRFALPYGKALRRPFCRDLFHHLRRLVAETPVCIAEIEERRTVRVGKVFFACVGRGEAVFVYFERSAVFPAFKPSGLIVKPGVGFV